MFKISLRLFVTGFNQKILTKTSFVHDRDAEYGYILDDLFAKKLLSWTQYECQ